MAHGVTKKLFTEIGIAGFIFEFLWYNFFLSRGVAQSGSASALGAEGREFESHRPDHSLVSGLFWPFCLASVAQLDRAAAF